MPSLGRPRALVWGLALTLSLVASCMESAKAHASSPREDTEQSAKAEGTSKDERSAEAIAGEQRIPLDQIQPPDKLPAWFGFDLAYSLLGEADMMVPFDDSPRVLRKIL